jgi:pimeloyl-ACP methyl ester carboxylesterase
MNRLKGLYDFVDSLGRYEAPPRLIPEPRESGFTTSFDGTRIYWELHGPSPADSAHRPLVFCYGLVCSMNQWRAQLERYAADRPCLLLDYRGHHKSDFPADEARMNLSALAKDVAAVLRVFGPPRPAHIWAHSLGVNVALELAAAEPELCASLVLCCGTAENPLRNMLHSNIPDLLLSPVLTAYPGRETSYNLVWKLLQRRPEFTELGARLLGFNMQASREGDVRTYARSVASVDPRTFFRLLRELSKGMTSALLSKVRVPTLVIAGARDHVTPPEQMQRLAEGLPDGVYVEIPAGSHNVQLDFGEYVGMKAEEFWRQRKLDSVASVE